MPLLRGFMGTDPTASILSGVALIGRSDGLVKSLRGFKKDRHSVPDSVNAATQAFLAKLCEAELKEEAELLFQQARVAMAYKRKDLSLDLAPAQAVLTTRDFTVEWSFALKSEDPARYERVRTLQGLRSPEVVQLEAFDGLFTRWFQCLVFTLAKGVAVESVIDAVEGLSDEPDFGLTVTYPSDCHQCVLKVEGVEASVRCTGSTLEVEFPQAGSPRELIAAFSEVRRAFVLTRNATLAGLW